MIASYQLEQSLWLFRNKKKQSTMMMIGLILQEKILSKVLCQIFRVLITNIQN